MISIPQLLGVLYWDNFQATVWCTLGVGFLFIFTYLIGISMAKSARIANG